MPIGQSWASAACSIASSIEAPPLNHHMNAQARTGLKTQRICSREKTNEPIQVKHEFCKRGSACFACSAVYSGDFRCGKPAWSCSRYCERNRVPWRPGYGQSASCSHHLVWKLERQFCADLVAELHFRTERFAILRHQHDV